MSRCPRLTVLFAALAAVPLLPPRGEAQQTPPAAAVDRDGDPQPDGAVARLGTIRFRHAAPVAALAFSPDGKTLASAGGDALRVWEVPGGRPLRTWPVKFRSLLGAATFTPDGRHLLVADLDATRLIDADSGREVAALEGATVLQGGVALAPDGRTAAVGGSDGVVTLYGRDGKSVRKLEGHDGSVPALAFTPDGATLVSGGEDKTVRVWEVTTGKELRRLDHPGGPVQVLAISPDGKRLAAGGGELADLGAARVVTVWDLATGAEIRRVKGHLFQVKALAFSPDGKLLASAGADPAVLVWRCEDGTLARQLTSRGGETCALRFSPDGTLLAAAGADGVRLWDPTTGETRGPARGHTAAIQAVAFSPDGKTLATGGDDTTVRLWNPDAGTEARPPLAWRARVEALAYAADGQSLASAGTGLVVRNLGSGRERQPLGFFAQPLFGRAAFAEDGNTLAAGTLGRGSAGIATYDVASGKARGRCAADPLTIRAVAVSPDGRRVAVGEWDVRAAAGGGAVRVCDTASGRDLWRRPAHDRSADALAFAPGGQLLASGGSDGVVSLWDVESGQPRGECRSPDRHVAALAFSADGRMLAAGFEDGMVRVWERATFLERRSFIGHLGEVHALRFRPDGRRLASGGADTTALVWRLEEDAPATRPSAEEWEKQWFDLGSGDATVAFRSVLRLAAGGAPAVDLLRAKLRPAAAPDAAQLARWVTQLDSDRFAVRQKAEDELARQGEAARPALRAALEGKPSAELRGRVQRLLDRLEGTPAGEPLRQLRAVEALERAATPEARRLLEELAKGTAEARLTREAAESLRRLEGRLAAAER